MTNTIKSIFATCFLLFATTLLLAQVGVGTSTPAESAQLDVSSTTKGFLPPRVALSGTSDVTTIKNSAGVSVTPATGLFVYNTATVGTSPSNVTPGFYYFSGSAWVRLIGPTDNAANVSGTVAVANGGTNSTAAATAGGIGYGTGTAHAYTGVGATGQVLSSNGAGVPTWITLSTGGIPYTGANAAVNLGAYDLTVNGLTIGKGLGNKTNNTAIGNATLSSNTFGFSNTANGSQSLKLNTTGNYNTAIGTSSLSSNTEGGQNTSVGIESMLSNTTGNGNAAIGRKSLASNTEGNYNTGLGIDALSGNTTGSYGVGIGQGALGTNKTGRYNTAVGPGADVATDNLTNATAIGKAAIVSASNTIQLGNTSVTNVKTSGTITAGAVTYPNLDGSNGQVLTTNGAGVPTWITPSTGNASTVTNGVYTVGDQTIAGVKTFSSTIVGSVSGSATSATTATNLAQGLGGQIPYQSAAGTTAMLANGTAGQVLQSNGTTLAPSWVTAATGGESGGTHTIGESYGGGKVFYVYDNGKHGLIAATSDQSTGIRWHGGSYVNTRARADGVGAGKKNTAIIIANQGSVDGNAFAATVCNEYSVTETVGGITTTYGDWYLPSKYELGLLYLNKVAVGVFANNSYWSSSETSIYDALFRNFNDGTQGTSTTNTTYYVRAIRAF